MRHLCVARGRSPVGCGDGADWSGELWRAPSSYASNACSGNALAMRWCDR